MKTTLTILLIIFLSSTLGATELEWVDEQIEAIKPPRKGADIRGIGDPFVFLKKNKPEVKKGVKASYAPRRAVAPSKASSTISKSSDSESESVKKDTFTLSAILNTSAMINGSWYKKSDKISSYIITDISKNTVTLKKDDKELMLSTISRNPNIKFKNK